MSRIGKKPVPLPAGVDVKVPAAEIVITGPKGELRQRLTPGVKVAVGEGGVVVTRDSDSKQHRALHGLYRALIQNMVFGVTRGYEKRLRIVGTGYRVELKGRVFSIVAGFSHPVDYQIPPGIEIEVPKATSREYMDFIVRGIDKQAVGEAAAKIRRVRPPDLYQGKGIRYTDEHVRRLEGKSFGAGGK
ncbi:MAG: 50S ribosomal protein L6 [Planctomycetota bacterium]|jgi:large subunit ribosomal protein L6|nr:50S ribosomal protein L6 [Planctomycetota bacterium]